MTQTIAVIDYGMGNLRSVSKALEHVAPGARVLVTDAAAQIAAADRVVFPGQGAARDCMGAIARHQLAPVIADVAACKPFLGICMGLQVLLDRSEENEGTDLLGLFHGQVRRFDGRATGDNGLPLKIPHMGWSEVRQIRPHPLWDGIPDNSRFYFVHSYRVVPEDVGIIAGTTDYGVRFTSAVADGNLFATQFHPEKSAGPGLRLLANFVNWNP
jgi:imidazole glycerol-phosphate synthase subunit HisH